MTSVGGSGVSTKTHYARLGHAAQNLIPRFLQEVLLYYEHPKNIYIRCNTNPQISYRLKSADWTKINEAVNTGSYKNFDIPLIYTILRNLNISILTPTNGWAYQVDPQSHEKNTGDDLERCRRKRNLIIHRGNTEVSDQELNEYFDVFKNIAGRLQVTLNKKNNEFVSEVEDLRTCCMDEDTERKYLEEIEEWRCRSLEYEDQISQLKEHLLVVFIKALKETTCFEGETVILQCIVSGSKCIAEWLQNDEEILYGRKIRQECLSDIIDDIHVQVYKLVISESTEEDSGTYTIKLGSKTSSCVLSVTERQPSLIKLRSYQLELAEIALRGNNTMICAGTNAGKTYVAFHVIESHLLKNPKGKVVFINKTNVLLGQQHRRAIDTFTTLHFQGKIKIWSTEEDDSDYFEQEIEKASLIFMTPKSLSNHLIESAVVRVSIDKFTLIILDECHHTHDKNLYNELMSFYRIAKYKENLHRLPQILGLTASPGTNKAKDVASAKDHLRKVMANLDVTELSVVEQNKEELLEHTSIPEKVTISSTTRKKDPLKDILFDAMEYVEHQLNSRIGRPQGEQIEVLEKFRNGEHLCIVSTSVGCEGLDVPQCNMMIRYRFSADEISSLQMRGRVRTTEGQEVIIGTPKEFETEMRNIECQFLMGHAIEEVSKLNIARDIAIAEKNIYEMEELERETARIKISQKTTGLFTVNCKYCGVVITDGGLMRHVNERMFFVCDNTMLARVDKRPIAKKKQKEFDGFKKQGKAYGIECRHNWGSIIIYKEREFVALSQDYIQIFDCEAGKFINCKKWCDLKFKIEAMSNDDFMSYNTQLA
ncbi:endoribonuclease Dicer [Mytilus galloprovincialis]|uniref:Endoribonuclease Dicer n=1 Tax=Mytilus galloprovincialis TaxID=29158 RepID=A0A8B6HNY9_MYTGA|nr:endoribonuclease Dicer [Mytilus galloprovincialis]